MKNHALRKLTAIILIAVASAITFPHSAFAQEKEAAPAPAEKKKSDNLPFNGKLKAVDKAAGTITLPGKEKDRVFTVSGKTKIVKNGQPATLGDAVVGEDVGGLAKKVEGGNPEVLSLRLGAKPEEEGAPKKEKKAKKEMKEAK